VTINNVYQRPVPVYTCPYDPSVGPDGVVTDNQGTPWGASSYAGNIQVLCQVNPFTWELIDPRNYATLDSFSEGTSNTILLAEKYARCTNAERPAGGTFWAYAIVDATVQPLHPGFALSWTAFSVGPASKFQVAPTPFLGNCDPRLTSTPHQALQAALADGSIRSISPSISGATWWAACTPRGGEPLGSDW
jgi:hypothetical protein